MTETDATRSGPPKPAPLDLDYRPETYWDGYRELLASVKGEARRAAIEAAVADGDLASIPEGLLSPTVTNRLRDVLGAMHPTLMGGEYLPDARDEEVEIARIVLESVTSDVISLRAHRLASGMQLSMVDEYETRFVLPTDRAPAPLTLREVIHVLDNAWSPENHARRPRRSLPDRLRDDNLDAETPEDIATFVRVKSVFYRDLERWYEQDAERWVARRKKRRPSAGLAPGP